MNKKAADQPIDHMNDEVDKWQRLKESMLLILLKCFKMLLLLLIN